MNKMFMTESWLNVTYHYVIYVSINSLMTTLTRTIILRIKDQSNYQIKGIIIKINSNKRKGRNKYYFKITRDKALVT